MSLRIHLAEDEPRSARLIEKLLQNLLEAEPVFDRSRTVRETINLLKINLPDLLILDLELSGRSGFEVLDALPNRAFPIIITSARKDLAYPCFHYGVQDYLLKPINPAEFRQAIKRCERYFPLAHGYPPLAQISPPVANP